MSSGEVLFILGFIVLPTAILVSSVWAVIFVRRRPDRVYPEPETATEPAFADRDASQDQTAVFPTMPVHAEPNEDDLPVTEHDVVVITDEHEPEALVDEPVDETAAVEETHEDEHEAVAQAEPLDVETPVLQSTEDLDDVVNTLRDLGQVVGREEPAEEPEELPAEEVEVIESDEPEEETFSRTSELPAIGMAEDPQPVESATSSPQPHPADQETEEPAHGPRWRRRKQSVKLRPGDPDAPRARGRNRDPQRQVPQIVRPARRRDDAGQAPPPDPDPDADSTSTRD